MAAIQATEVQTPDFGEKYDAVIIGAGVGGLTCGALLAAEGLKVLVVERHDRPGGFVTDYERKGYRFQVPQIMGGCGYGGDLTRVMDRLGMNVEFKRVDPVMRFVYPGRDIRVSGDLDAFAETLKDDFQPQTQNLNRFLKMATRVNKASDPRMLRKPRGAAGNLRGLAYPLVHPRMVSMMARGTTVERMLDSFFGDDELKAVLATPWPLLGSPPWELSALAMLGMMRSFDDGAYVPLGGYGVLADSFAAALTENGGKLLLGHEVTAVNTEGGAVSGVELNPRSTVEVPVVVSDADSKRTFLSLLERESFPRSFVDRVDGASLSCSGFTVHLGMAKPLDDEGLACGPVMVHPSYDHRAMFEAVRAHDGYPDPGVIAWGFMVNSAVDPSLAPAGGSCVDIVVPGVPYGFMGRWGVEGGVRGEKYGSIKEQYAEVVVDAVSRQFPELVSDVEAYDISTPVTFERYTMAADGCWYDCAPVPGQAMGRRPGPRTPLRGLYVTGAKSVMGGGIYASVMSGLLAADSVLKGSLGHLFPGA